MNTAWPSPAQDYDTGPLSLDRVLLASPANFLVQVSQSDELLGLAVGDRLVVDRSLDPRRGDLVVAVVEGEHVVGQLEGSCLVRQTGRCRNVKVWGVVVCLVHPYARLRR